MISEINISNYRACVHTRLLPQPDLSVLIGPNGCGKTTILQAILLLKSLAAEDIHYHPDSPPTDDSNLKVAFQIEDKKVILTSDFLLHTDNDNSDIVIESNVSWYAKDFTGNAKRLHFPLWLADHLSNEHTSPRLLAMRRRNLRHIHFKSRHDIHIPNGFFSPISKISQFVNGIKYYSASQFTNPSLCPISFEVDKNQGRSARRPRSAHERFLLDLYAARKTNKPKYDEFVETISANEIGLIDEIRFQEITTSTIDHRVRSGGRIHEIQRERMLVIPQFIIGKNILSPSQLSEGTFKTITLLFYLMTDESQMLLIEEPEVCVHHGLLSSIIELIKIFSKEKQIIISTHSDFILDQIDMRQLYRVSRDDDGGVNVRQITKTISKSEVTALKEYLATEGNLGEYWRHGGFE